jgi:hypothetical protein
MSTIVIKPKTKEEQIFLTRLFKKMNVEAHVVQEPIPNFETRKAMEDVEMKKGERAGNSKDLFNKLGI